MLDAPIPIDTPLYKIIKDTNPTTFTEVQGIYDLSDEYIAKLHQEYPEFSPAQIRAMFRWVQGMDKLYSETNLTEQ